jgi:hypothetical protein
MKIGDRITITATGAVCSVKEIKCDGSVLLDDGDAIRFSVSQESLNYLHKTHKIDLEE